MFQNLDESAYQKAWKMCVPIWPVMWPWLAVGNRNIRNCTKQSSPRVSSAPAFAKQTMAVQAYFSSPPRLSPLFWRVSLSLGIIFWLAPTLGQWVRLLCSDLRSGPICAVRFFSVPCPPECYLQSENENRAWSQVSFVGLDLRSGNTLTINELEKWCFEIIRT